MDKAVVMVDGTEAVMSAGKFKAVGLDQTSSFCVRAYCPCCRQPVDFFAGEHQSPHFRHTKNNPWARWCELFSQNRGGGEAQYDLIPPPLFIKQSPNDSVSFIVELGLKRIRDSLLATLEAEGAVLVVNDDPNGRRREFHVTKERFGVGMFKIPIHLAQNFSFSGIRLVHTAKRFWDVWGIPSGIGSSVVFRCDEGTVSGRRVEDWGHVAVGDQLIIASTMDVCALRRSFPDLEEVGATASRLGGKGLRVYLGTVNECSSAFLEELLISIRPADDIPVILWPPALQSTGEVVPLFSESDCLFRVRATSESDGHIRTILYTHLKADIKRSSSVPLKKTLAAGWATAIVRPAADICFLSTSDQAFSNAILLSFREHERRKRLSEIEQCPRINSFGRGEYEITTYAVCCAKLMSKGGGRPELYRFHPGDVTDVSIGRRGLLRILGDVVLSEHGDRVLLDFDVRGAEPLNGMDQVRRPSFNGMRIPGLSRDRCFAEERKSLVRPAMNSAGAKLALTRKAL